MTELSDLELIDQLSATFEKNPETPEVQEVSLEPETQDEYQKPLSPTLEALEPTRRPSQEVVCATCPNSVWFASKAEVKGYCRVMYLVTWSSKEPNEILMCDGTALT